MNPPRIVRLEKIPSYGDKMTLVNFLECCRTGALVDYDGTGRLATVDRITDIRILPSDLSLLETAPDSLDHVVWFNR